MFRVLDRLKSVRTRWFAFGVAAAVVAGLVYSVPGTSVDAGVPGGTLVADSVAVETQWVPASFADVIEAVKPSVVNISTRRTVVAAGPFPGFEGSPFDEQLRRFFERRQGPFNGDPNGRVPPQPEMQAMGSGFIVSPDGWVVTNNHVVDTADSITVTLHDGRQFDATLRGIDEKTDLALLKIEAEDLPHAAFGDSDDTRVGDWVIAIGNPFGLGGTATTGVVSARGRDINAGPYDDFLQIDAPINRGNSGGPLFDLRGRVIGVNTAIYSPNGGSVGIGFAIPASQAGPVIDDLRADGRVERGWLGVSIQSIDESIAEGLGLETDEGALVAEVVADSPASQAGLQAGDVIVRFADRQIAEAKDLSRVVAEQDPDSKVAMEVLRNGDRQTMKVRLGDSPDAKVHAAAPAVDSSGPRLGLRLSDLDGETRSRLGLGREVEGALVTAVEPGSPAARQGLRPGDVVARVGRVSVSDAQSAIDAVRGLPEGTTKVVLQIVRGGAARFVALEVGE